MKISISVLQDSRIQQILKIIAEVLRQSSLPIVKQVGDVVGSLRKYWKGLMKPKAEYDESFVSDKSLQRTVCVKTANVLEYNRFERNIAREIAVGIEKNLRKLDPTMTQKYKQYFRKMIKEIKFITPELYSLTRESTKGTL